MRKVSGYEDYRTRPKPYKPRRLDAPGTTAALFATASRCAVPRHLRRLEFKISPVLAFQPERLAPSSTPHCSALWIKVFRLDFSFLSARKKLLRIEVEFFDRKHDFDEDLVADQRTVPGDLRLQLTFPLYISGEFIHRTPDPMPLLRTSVLDRILNRMTILIAAMSSPPPIQSGIHIDCHGVSRFESMPTPPRCLAEFTEGDAPLSIGHTLMPYERPAGVTSQLSIARRSRFVVSICKDE